MGLSIIKYEQKYLSIKKNILIQTNLFVYNKVQTKTFVYKNIDFYKDKL